MIAKWIVLVACAANAVSASHVFSIGHEGDDLVALCKNRSVDLTQISQLASLVEQLDAGVECPDLIASAIRELKKTIDANRGDECSMASFERFRDYYKKYLDTSDPELRKNTDKLPSDFKRFALGYELEVSSLCRVNMVKILVNDVGSVITPQDMEEVRSLVGPEGVLVEQMGCSKRPDELMLPSDYISVLEMSKDKTKKKIGLKMATTPVLKRIQIVCERRFKPIYGPVMLPLARMANLGFEHRGKELKKELQTSIKNANTCQDVAQWSRIVMMCESLGQIELVEEKKDGDQAEGNDATLVRVFTPEQAEEAKKVFEGEDLLKKVRVKDEDIQVLQFEPKLGVQIPDKILRTFDVRQKISLAWLSTNRDEAANIRMRFFTKTYKKVFEDMRHFKLNSFLAFFYNKVREEYNYLRRIDTLPADQKARSVDRDIVTDIVQKFNDRVDSELSPDLAVADGFDDIQCPDCECPSFDDCCCCCDGCGGGSGNVCLFFSTKNYYGNGGYGHGGYGTYHRSSGAGIAILKTIGFVILIVIAILIVAAIITAVASVFL